MFNNLNELALNVRYAEQERDTRLASALERATALSARLDALLASRPVDRPEWIASKPVWPTRQPVSMPANARDVAFAQLAVSRKAA